MQPICLQSSIPRTRCSFRGAWDFRPALSVTSAWLFLKSLAETRSHARCPWYLFHENLANDEFGEIVSGSFAYAMEAMADHIVEWDSGDPLKACEIWQKGLSELHMYGDFSLLHIRYRVAAWLRGLMPESFMCPPMPKPTQEEARTLHTLPGKCGLSLINGKDMNPVMTKVPLRRTLIARALGRRPRPPRAAACDRKESAAVAESSRGLKHPGCVLEKKRNCVGRVHDSFVGP